MRDTDGRMKRGGAEEADLRLVEKENRKKSLTLP